MKALTHPAHCLLAVLLASSVLCADTLHLKSGTSSEVVVIEETEDAVTVLMGGGKMTLPRNRIARIELAKKEENDALKAQWSVFDMGNLQNTPVALKPLAEAYQDLKEQHVALKIAYRKDSSKYQLHQATQKQLRSAGQATSKSNQKLHEAYKRLQMLHKQRRDIINEANEIVAHVEKGTCGSHEEKELQKKHGNLLSELSEVNMQLNEAKELHDELKKKSASLQKKQRHLKSTLTQRMSQNTIDLLSIVSSYKEALSTFNDAIEAADTPSVRANHAYELARFRGEGILISRSVQTAEIPFEQKNNLILCEVLINKQTATLMIDPKTPSSFISKDLATRSGLDLSNAPRIKSARADGKLVSAYKSELERIDLGGISVQDVRVTVMESSE